MQSYSLPTTVEGNFTENLYTSEVKPFTTNMQPVSIEGIRPRHYRQYHSQIEVFGSW